MRFTKETTQAFIVRIWIEPREWKAAKPIWRGVIEHVGSGERVYFDQLQQIASHILPYIEAMEGNIDRP